MSSRFAATLSLLTGSVMCNVGPLSDALGSNGRDSSTKLDIARPEGSDSNTKLVIARSEGSDANPKLAIARPEGSDANPKLDIARPEGSDSDSNAITFRPGTIRRKLLTETEHSLEQRFARGHSHEVDSMTDEEFFRVLHTLSDSEDVSPWTPSDRAPGVETGPSAVFPSASDKNKTAEYRVQDEDLLAVSLAEIVYYQAEWSRSLKVSELNDVFGRGLQVYAQASTFMILVEGATRAADGHALELEKPGDATSPVNVFLVLRGTYDLRDVEHDLDLQARGVDSGDSTGAAGSSGKELASNPLALHGGFRYALERDDFLNVFSKFRQQLRELLGDDQARAHFHVAGHSLGGAAAFVFATEFLSAEKNVDLVTNGCPMVFFKLLRAAQLTAEAEKLSTVSKTDSKIAAERKERAKVREHWRTFILRSDGITNWSALSLTHLFSGAERAWLERAPVKTILLYEEEGRDSGAWRAVALSNMPHSPVYVERVVSRLSTWNAYAAAMDHRADVYVNALFAITAATAVKSQVDNSELLSRVEEARLRNLNFVRTAALTLAACEKESHKCDMFLNAVDLRSLLAFSSARSEAGGAWFSTSSAHAVPKAKAGTLRGRMVQEVSSLTASGAFARMSAIPELESVFQPSLFNRFFAPRQDDFAVDALPSALCFGPRENALGDPFHARRCSWWGKLLSKLAQAGFE